MQIQGIYAALATADIKAAEAFCTKLFGRGPNDWPMEGLIQWRDVGGAHIHIFQNDVNAGVDRLTIVAPLMSDARTALSAMGVALEDEREGDYPSPRRPPM